MLNLKNTLDGYLKNVEVIGNTIQDANNLADIRSVGDKVEGQELYKIPVVSCGKNILSEIWRDGRNGSVDTYCGFKLQLDVNKSYTVSIKYKRTIPNTEDVLGAISPLVNPNSVKSKFPNKIYQTIFSRSVLHHSMTFSSNCMQDDGTCYLTIYPGNNATDFGLYNSFIEGFIEYIQIEEGTQVTPYEPYKENKLEILSPVQLEKVGDVADRIICKDGVWGVEKNIGDGILIGTESWDTYTNYTSDTMYSAYTPFPKFKPDSKLVINTHSSSSSLSTTEEYISMRQNLAIGVLKTKASNASSLKAYLSSNPVHLKGILAQPQFMPLPHDQQVKLRTFAGQTNIAFLTEIPGQIKAQVPKSLGATVNTHTEQIAELHNSLDRVKKLEETTVSTVETGSNFTTVDATSNGYFEDVKLEGKTLVDRTDIFNKVNPTGVAVYQKTNNSLIVDYSKCGEIDKARSLDETNVFKSGQIYTIIIDILQNTLNQKVEFYPMIWDFATVISGTQFVSVGEIGRKIFVIKANKDYSLKLAYASPGQATQGVTGLVEFKDIMVLDGDYTNKELPSYFEGLMSVGQDVEEVSVGSASSGNLLDLSRIVVGKYIANNNVDVEHGTSFYCDKYVKVYPGVKYQLIASDNSKQIGRVSCYNKNGNYISTTEYATNTPIYFDSTVDTIRLSFFDRLHLKDMLYFGTNSNYIGQVIKLNKKPLLYFNPTTETWEKPILREWDTIEKHTDGKYYYHKRSGEIVLNGSEGTWGISGINHDSKNILRFFVNIDAKPTSSNDIEGYIISDTFTTNTYNGMFDLNVEGIAITQDSKIGISILKSKLTTQDVAGFKAWMKANPVTVVYHSMQEEVYECTNIDLMTYSGETNYIINSGAISPKSLLKVHNNISNVVKILQEKVSLLENTFIAGLKSVLSGDMYSLATILYPEDFEQNDNTEQDIMVIPE